MNTADINTKGIGTELGLKLGCDEAPIKSIEFINYRCPFARKFFQSNSYLLDEWVAAGKLQRIIKSYDRDKHDLSKANILHQYIDYGRPEEAYELIHYFYANQDVWGEMDHDGVKDWVENVVGLERQANEEIAQAIRQEGEDNGVRFVPTVILAGHILDEHEDHFTIRKWLAEALEDQDLANDFDPSALNDSNGFVLGLDQAEKTIYQFIDLYEAESAAYVKEAFPILRQALASGQVRLVTKIFSLRHGGGYKGEVMQRFVDYQTPEKALYQVEEILARRPEWVASDFEGVFKFAEEELGYDYQGNQAALKAAYREGKAVGVEASPAVFIDGQGFHADQALSALQNKL
ncbi:thioredoxin domain-containing protein [Aerococcus sanguinicola]|uniref:thioredoxin domain-containing protein n=1 Tax=unclassified Aerococcus TaxID=2618060 RepID=UPI0008A2306E|nr:MULTISPECIES: thioredoxin domain-containing protein [unclassified Aerococcus]KAB0645776.1 thioredoxin domain-containing protein [Aerococcus sanguinicola]MDK6234391.1 thioredoxin domain-containing protein [Aerococcus sp. UMB10185]MDK6856660.1 thioredoxin domain-containing protein [Aerococcus sp. UMB7533]OFN01288.1 hypothetical protein HMPREF2626_07915 [Aerococcus sp. HMSC062A02]OHO44442.1 hypothetical protein HMPREF2705_06900 [Aerococcus sp. HMSC035B07]